MCVCVFVVVFFLCLLRVAPVVCRWLSLLSFVVVLGLFIVVSCRCLSFVGCWFLSVVGVCCGLLCVAFCWRLFSSGVVGVVCGCLVLSWLLCVVVVCRCSLSLSFAVVCCVLSFAMFCCLL